MKKRIILADKAEITYTNTKVEVDLFSSPLRHLTPLGVEKVWDLFTTTKRHTAKYHVGTTYSYISAVKDSLTPIEVALQLAEICRLEGTRSTKQECVPLSLIEQLAAKLNPTAFEKQALGATDVSFYKLYLASPEWKAKQREALERAENRCESCHIPGEAIGARLQVHHRTYERLGHEEPGDLEALCAGCHRKADNERRRTEVNG